MAQRVVVKLVDDLDGTEATTTVKFSVEGRAYELDLNDENLRLFRESADRWIAHARPIGRAKVTGKGGGKGMGPARRDRAQTEAIRAWAKEAGLPVSDRGRIPGDIVEAWGRAHELVTV